MARRSASWAAGSSPACTSSTTGRTQPPEAAERVADQLRMGRLLELERTTELPLAIFRHGLVQSPEVAPRLRLAAGKRIANGGRSEEHTSELQSLMRISYAVLCLNKNNNDT